MHDDKSTFVTVELTRPERNVLAELITEAYLGERRAATYRYTKRLKTLSDLRQKFGRATR